MRYKPEVFLEQNNNLEDGMLEYAAHPESGVCCFAFMFMGYFRSRFRHAKRVYGQRSRVLSAGG